VSSSDRGVLVRGWDGKTPPHHAPLISHTLQSHEQDHDKAITPMTMSMPSTLFTCSPHSGDDRSHCDWVLSVATNLVGLQVGEGLAQEGDRGIDAHLRALDLA
jgi:hypothetical protein